MTQYQITTTDNPHDPFTNPSAWADWDLSHYNSMSMVYMLANAPAPDEAPEEYIQELKREAIQQIIDEHLITPPEGEKVIMVSREVP